VKMVSYRINLARDIVISLEVRKRWSHWLLLYFLLSALVISGTVYAVLSKARELGQRQEIVRRQEANYLRAHGLTDAEQYWAGLSARLDRAIRELEFLRGCQPRPEKRVAAALLGPVRDLPRGAELAGVELDLEAHKLRCDVVTPADHDLTTNNTPARWMETWAKDPLLAGRIRQITSDTSERSQVAGVPVMLWRFSAEFD